MLTAILISAFASLPTQPLTIHEAVERAVDREWVSVTMDHAGRGHAEARLKLGYYMGIMAFDFVTTQMATNNQDYGEMNPLPGFGTSKGRAIGMALIGAGWTVLDRALVAHGHTRAAKALRFVLGAYAGSIVSWNLGWQSAWTPDNLIPSQWQRDAAKPKDYSWYDANGVGQQQRAYDACVMMSAHRKGSCWK